MVMVHDNVLPGVKRALDSIGIDRLTEPDKVMLVSDHEVLYGSPRAALYGVTNRQAAKAWGMATLPRGMAVEINGEFEVA